MILEAKYQDKMKFNIKSQWEYIVEKWTDWLCLNVYQKYIDRAKDMIIKKKSTEKENIFPKTNFI